jgi:DNA-binding response OmpR family regulator
MQRILVVEDDPHFGRQIVDLFGFHGYEVALADHGILALDQFRSVGADLIITDLMLPQMSGVDFVRELRSSREGSEVPVIMMSAVYKNPRMFEKELRALNVLEFLAKPFSLIELGRKVDAILDEKVAADLSDAEVTKSGSWRVADLEGMLGEGALGFPDAGKFDRLTLLKILIEIFKCHAAGRLTLRRGRAERRIYFLNGYPVWARSENEAELLGEVLIKLKLLDRAQLKACLALASRDGIMFRDAVIRAGHLDESRMFRAERERIQRIVVQTFEWADGEYDFSRRDDFVDRVGVFEVNPIVCLVEAVHRFLTVNDLAADIEHRSLEVLIEGSRFRRLVGYLKLPVELGGLLECMRGDTTVGQLFQKFGMACDALIKNLWLMFSLDIADTLQAPARPADDEVMHEATGYLPSAAEFDLDEEDDEVEDGDLSEHARGIVGDYFGLIAATFYEVLGVPQDVQPVEVDRSWLRVRARFDPRKLLPSDPSKIYGKAKQLMDRADRAWRTLRDPSEKAIYDNRARSMESDDFRLPD